jgi:hypothetical protein
LNDSTCTKCHENPPIGSKVFSGGLIDRQTERQKNTHTHTQTDRQAGDLISPLSFFESRLKSPLLLSVCLHVCVCDVYK